MTADSPLSHGKYMTLIILTMISSTLSIASSIAIARISFLKLISTYQRFLFMTSLSTLINSMFLLWHPLLIPHDPSTYDWAVGNTDTCIMEGFFFIFGGLSVALYSCFLSVYFYCSITNNPNKTKMPEDVIGPPEFVAHLLCLLCPAAIAGAAVGTNSIDFDRKTDLCLPLKQCNEGDFNCVDSIFSRGSVTANSESIMITFGTIIIIATFVAIMATLAIYSHARKAFRKDNEQNDNDSSGNSNQRLRAVWSQAILFLCSFLNSFLWIFIVLGVPSKTEANTYFVLQIFGFVLYPLHGLINSIIYIRPRYQMLRFMYPDDSRNILFRVALSTAGDPDEIEHVRATILGDEYIPPPSVASSEESRDEEIPTVINFTQDTNVSVSSDVSTPSKKEESSIETA